MRRRRNRRSRTPPLSQLRFRRSPHLVAFWKNGALVVENFATGRLVQIDPLVAHVLNACDTWQTAATLANVAPVLSRRTLGQLLLRLARESMLQRSDRKPAPAESQMQGWAKWNPAAGFFHFSTKRIRYPWTPEQYERRLRRKALTEPQPAPVKRYRDRARVALPRPRVEGELSHTLLERRTWRAFGRGKLPLEALATLLNLTWGVQKDGIAPGQGRVVFKTSPSGGARHPIEAYVLARRVDGLVAGLYHYDSDHHRLIRLRRGASGREIAKLLGNQPWFGGAGAVVFMTAVFPRTQWRYEAPRVYRTVLVEAGHLCQTFCLLATSLGLAPFCTLALDDFAIERALGIDGVTESVIYAAGVGTRGAKVPPVALL